jgi:hypothetical protein
MVRLDLKVFLFLLENKSHGIQIMPEQKQGLRFVLENFALPAALPLMMCLMETSTASMEDQLEDMAHLALALPATLASVVQTVLSVQQAIVDHLLMIALLILVKPHQTLLTMGLTVTFTASMGETLVGLLAPAPVLIATLHFMARVVLHLITMLTTWMDYSTRSVIMWVAIITLATPSWRMGTLRF